MSYNSPPPPLQFIMIDPVVTVGGLVSVGAFADCDLSAGLPVTATGALCTVQRTAGAGALSFYFREKGLTVSNISITNSDLGEDFFIVAVNSSGIFEFQTSATATYTVQCYGYYE